jgi:hypothetical protein
MKKKNSIFLFILGILLITSCLCCAGGLFWISQQNGGYINELGGETNYSNIESVVMHPDRKHLYAVQNDYISAPVLIDIDLETMSSTELATLTINPGDFILNMMYGVDNKVYVTIGVGNTLESYIMIFDTQSKELLSLRNIGFPEVSYEPKDAYCLTLRENKVQFDPNYWVLETIYGNYMLINLETLEVFEPSMFNDECYNFIYNFPQKIEMVMGDEDFDGITKANPFINEELDTKIYLEEGECFYTICFTQVVEVGDKKFKSSIFGNTEFPDNNMVFDFQNRIILTTDSKLLVLDTKQQ